MLLIELKNAKIKMSVVEKPVYLSLDVTNLNERIRVKLFPSTTVRDIKTIIINRMMPFSYSAIAVSKDREFPDDTPVDSLPSELKIELIGESYKFILPDKSQKDFIFPDKSIAQYAIDYFVEIYGEDIEIYVQKFSFKKNNQALLSKIFKAGKYEPFHIEYIYKLSYKTQMIEKRIATTVGEANSIFSKDKGTTVAIYDGDAMLPLDITLDEYLQSKKNNNLRLIDVIELCFTYNNNERKATFLSGIKFAQCHNEISNLYQLSSPFYLVCDGNLIEENTSISGFQSKIIIILEVNDLIQKINNLEESLSDTKNTQNPLEEAKNLQNKIEQQEKIIDDLNKKIESLNATVRDQCEQLKDYNDLVEQIELEKDKQ